MSTVHGQESPAKLHLPSLRHRPNINVEDPTDIMRPHRKKLISSSLDSIHISPRAQTMELHSRRASDTAERDEVQLSLLSQEHEPAHDDAVSFGNVHKKNKTLSVKDRKAMALLIVLCPSAPSHRLSSVAHHP
jgi:PAT family acetyl-CoA transporter-like MFS transporter 1